ncbi:unnamed protein product, partial [Closterium sp. NIES-64]
MAAASKTKIYGLKLSTCTKRVLTALEEKNVTDYEFVTIDLSKGEQKSAEFKKKQPFGVIPVLEDEDVELFESRAIARYVADKYAEQGTNLLGSTLKERALVNLWLEVESQNYNPPISGLIAEKIFKPRKGLTTDEAKAAEYKAKLSQVLDVYEARLASNDYLSGSFFSLADLVHLPYTAMLWVSGDSDPVPLALVPLALVPLALVPLTLVPLTCLLPSPCSPSQVVGLGASGRAAARLALARGAAAVIGLDRRTDAKALERGEPLLLSGWLDRRTDAKALEVCVLVLLSAPCQVGPSMVGGVVHALVRGAAAVIGLAGQEDRRQGTGTRGRGSCYHDRPGQEDRLQCVRGACAVAADGTMTRGFSAVIGDGIVCRSQAGELLLWLPGQEEADAKALEDDPSVWDGLPEPASSPPLISISRLSTHLGPHPLPLLLSASLVVLSPGVPLSESTISQALSQTHDSQALSLGVPMLSELAFAYDSLPPGMPIAAVTGTNGKSTVATFAGQVMMTWQVLTWNSIGIHTFVGGNLGGNLGAPFSLAVAASSHLLTLHAPFLFPAQILESIGIHTFVGGNLGTPLSLAALECVMASQHGSSGGGKQLPRDCSPPAHVCLHAAVVEVSSYQMELPGRFRPKAAVILNLTPDHLERHGNMESYGAAKCHLFARMGESEVAIIPS